MGLPAQVLILDCQYSGCMSIHYLLPAANRHVSVAFEGLPIPASAPCTVGSELPDPPPAVTTITVPNKIQKKDYGVKGCVDVSCNFFRWPSQYLQKGQI